MQYAQPFDQPLVPNAPYVDGNATTGQAGSIPRGAAIEDPQREILNALAAASLTPANGDLTQLAQAMSIGLWLGAMGGSANALADTLPTLATTSDGVTQYAIPSLQPGMTFHGIIPATNTGAATLTLTGFGTAPGAKPIVKKDGVSPVQAGDLPAGAVVTWKWDGTSYRVIGVVQSDVLALIAALQIPGGRQQQITGSGIWMPPAGLTVGSPVLVKMNGGGGGGGGAFTSGSYPAAGVGGGGGEYAQGIILLTAADIANGIPYTAAGAVPGGLGSNPPTNGTNGQTTSFGGRISAAGGVAGTAGLNGISSGSGTGGTGGSGGSFRLQGGGGGFGIITSSTGTQGDQGGYSPSGCGGGPGTSPSVNANGTVGSPFGGGGAGGAATSASLSANGAGGSNGGNGAAGTILLQD